MSMRYALVFPLALGLWGCGDDEQPKRAAQLLRQIREEGYSSWQRAPGYPTRQPANSPHSDSVDIYVNTVVADALVGPPITSWPEGSIIVKDGFSGGNLELVAVMQKVDGEWFWAEYFGGEADYSGKPDVCLDCHRRSGSDFVRAFSLPR